MIDKRTLLPRLAVLGAMAFSLPVYAQYSSPMRNIDDPGRAPFQFWSQVNPLITNGFTHIVITSLPVGATQRLVVDFASVLLTTSSGTLQTDPFVQLTVTNSNTNAVVFNLVLPAPLTSSNSVAISSQPIRLYVSAGQTLTLNVGNGPTAGNANASVGISGHFVNLP
jgi:hypothetical protein